MSKHYYTGRLTILVKKDINITRSQTKRFKEINVILVQNYKRNNIHIC